MVPRSSADPPELFAWDADHEAGVTGDREEAVQAVGRALADGPDDAHGLVRRVQLGGATGVRYVTLGVVGTARRNPDSGAVVWSGGEPR